MISLALALALKEAGLTWKPVLHDFFAVPDAGLDDRVFVINDMVVNLERFFGKQAITFNGAVEWALDYILTVDTVWMPTEAQLRELLQDHLLEQPQPALFLISGLDGYRCQVHYGERPLEFEAADASEAYGRALLYMLEGQAAPPKSRE